jgi:hypothetical protein
VCAVCVACGTTTSSSIARPITLSLSLSLSLSPSIIDGSVNVAIHWWGCLLLRAVCPSVNQ